MSKKKKQPVTIDLIDYDIDYLDGVEGSVTDFQAPAVTTHTATHTDDHAAITRQSRGNLVLPTPAQAVNRPDIGGAGAMLMAGHNLAAQIMTGNEAVSRVAQQDSAETVARASLLYSSAYARPAALITVALLMLAYPLIGGPFAAYLFVGLLAWGVAILVVLLLNRRQGLHHSSTGIAHASISSNERVAMHAINVAHQAYKETVERTYGGRNV
jgi:hypothetical protein